MQDAKEEVRSRLNIEDVVGEYVQLKRAGRNFKGLSPFSGEKTPSFYVSPEKNIWHDFSSNKGGDIFGFIMEVEGVDFKEALEMLARKAGVELSAYSSEGGQRIARQKRRLLEMHRLAAQYYQQSLLKNQAALEYVFKIRGLNKDVVQAFQIGYAPDSGDALVRFLTKKGFSKQELSAGGVVNRFGGDLFRSRMMVPLMDGAGQVIGFTGRQLTSDPNSPKYLNTPQTLLYDKGRHVFGLSQAKEAIRAKGYTVVVEGNLDVVSSHQAGFNQVVATAGTAMTESHLKALVRLSPLVRLAFDGDAAGLAATERAIPIAQAVGVDLTIISLPNGVKDPDELIQQNPALWQQAIEGATDVIDWLLQQYSKRENISTPIGKRHFTSAALAVVLALKDPVEREHYMRKIAEYTSTTLEAIQEKLESTDAELSSANSQPKKAVHINENSQPDQTAHQDALLAVALIDEKVRPALSELSANMLANDERRAVLAYLRDFSASVVEVPKELQKYETYVKILLLKADARYEALSEPQRYAEASHLVRRIITEYKQIEKTALTNDLRAAEDIGDDSEALRLRQKLNELIKETPRAKK